MSIINIDELHKGIGNIAPQRCASFSLAARVCLHEESHSCPTTVDIQGIATETVQVSWTPPSLSESGSYADREEATEDGACGIAFLVMPLYTEYDVIERSAKGTGFDYWLGMHNQLPFAKSARLEISGIRKGTDGEIKKRVEIKKKQVRNGTSSPLPAYVSVTEFSSPKVVIERV